MDSTNVQNTKPSEKDDIFDPIKEYHNSDNIMCHYHNYSQPMRIRLTAPVVTARPVIAKKQHKFGSI